jgi:DNA-binding MarR family transcriptional regulator
MIEKNGFNETKYAILCAIKTAKRYLSPREISELSGIDYDTVKSQLPRLTKWHYIWRMQNPNANPRFKKSLWLYRYLKPKGLRVYTRYSEYKEIENVTGIHIPLKWYNVEPNFISKAREEYKRIMRIRSTI